MDKFAEIANIDYRLSFADYGKLTFVSRFRLQQTNGSCRFPLVPLSYIEMAANIYIEILIYIYTYIYLYIYISISIFICMLPFKMENGKRKPRRCSINRLPSAHRANGSLSHVRLFKKK
jgi:hypothetical protein